MIFAEITLTQITHIVSIIDDVIRFFIFTSLANAKLTARVKMIINEIVIVLIGSLVCNNEYIICVMYSKLKFFMTSAKNTIYSYFVLFPFRLIRVVKRYHHLTQPKFRSYYLLVIE